MNNINFLLKKIKERNNQDIIWSNYKYYNGKKLLDRINACQQKIKKSIFLLIGIFGGWIILFLVNGLYETKLFIENSFSIYQNHLLGKENNYKKLWTILTFINWQKKVKI